MEASREFPRVMRACHVMLVNATKTCCTSMAEDLFGESLIAQDVKMAMYLNISDKEKAEKLIDCVRVIVTIAPEKIYVFIKVLRRHGGEKAAKTLEEMISGSYRTLVILSFIVLVLVLFLVLVLLATFYEYHQAPANKIPSLQVNYSVLQLLGMLVALAVIVYLFGKYLQPQAAPLQGNKHQGVVLTEEDLPQLMRLLRDARGRWECIAIQLGLSYEDVDAIARKYPHNTSDCLWGSLILWLRREDPPTRGKLERALQSPLVERKDIAQLIVPALSQKQGNCIILVLSIIMMSQLGSVYNAVRDLAPVLIAAALQVIYLSAYTISNIIPWILIAAPIYVIVKNLEFQAAPLQGNYRALVFPFIVLLHLVIVFVYPQAPVQIQENYYALLILAAVTVYLIVKNLQLLVRGNYIALVFPFIVLLHLVIVFVYPQAPVQIQENYYALLISDIIFWILAAFTVYLIVKNLQLLVRGIKHQGVLHIEDLDDLLHLLDDVSASWKDIVTQLGLSQGDVEAIAYEKGDSPIDCLRESLILWLRGVDPAPTREQLARVLLSPLIGKEEIAQQVLYDTSFKLQYEKAMKEGTVSLQTTNSIVMGVAGSGKTRSLAMVMDEQLPQQRESTPLAKAPVITHSWVAMDDMKIQRIEDDKYSDILMNSIKDKIAKAPKESARAISRKYIAPKYGREVEDSILQHGLLIDEVIQQAAKNKTEHKELLENLRWNKLSDCGGQPQFLQILPMFVHDISLGIFTIKLNERLDSYPMIQFYEDDKPLGDPYKSLYTHEEILKYCMRTLVSQGSGLHKTKFLFLGTHEDLKDECNESIEEKNIKLNEIVALFNMQENTIFSSNNCCDLIFPVNADAPTPKDWDVMKEVRKAIAKNSCVPRIEVPIKWFALELVLLNYVKEKKKAVLSESTCFKMVNSTFNFDYEGFKAALKYLHRGKCIFHYEKKQLIVAHIQVFLDILTEAVCYNIDMCTNPEQPVEAVEFKWRKFKQGILHDSCLDQFASKHYIDGVFSRDDLLLMFIDLCILSKLGSDEYLMPCIMPAEEKPFSNPEPKTQKVPAMVVEFPDGGPMLGLYCALVCYLINIENWVLAMDKIKKPYHLTRNSIHFEAPGNNPGKVTLNDPLSTFFFVTYQGPLSVASKVCPLIRKTILNGIQCVSHFSTIKDFKPQVKFCLIRDTILNGISKILNSSIIKDVQLRPQITFLCPCKGSLHPAQIKGEYLRCPEGHPEYAAVPITPQQMMWREDSEVQPPAKKRVAQVLDKNITGQSQLNRIEWRKKNGVKKTLPLKEIMSVKWKKIGQNLEIMTNAKLKGFKDEHLGNNEECMDSVITEWFSKTSEKYPTTWAGLIKLLESVDLNALVNDILEAAADEESTLYEN